MTIRVVAVDTGELVAEGCPNCQTLATIVDRLQRDIQGKMLRIAQLEKDEEAELRAHPLWSQGVEVFDYWRRLMEKPRARFTAERFKLCLPFLEKDGIAQCQRAIRGCEASDWHMKRGRFASREGATANDFELIFRRRDRSKFERFCELAPEPPNVDQVHELAERYLTELPEDDRPLEDRIFESVRWALDRLRRQPAIA